MSLTKIEIFKIEISSDSRLSLDKIAQEKINLFLAEENNVYINHSTTILSENIEKYGETKTIDKFLVISVVYKDLNASEYDLKNTNTKIKNTVIREIRSGINMKETKIETSFDKEMHLLTNTINKKELDSKPK